MARYWVYLFRDEVAHSYYQRPEKIIGLLQEYQAAPSQQIYRKQMEFITDRISFSRLELGMKQYFSGIIEKNIERNMLVLKDGKTNDDALIIVQQRRLFLISDSQALTKQLFQALAMISPSFLAVDVHFRHYQWLGCATETEERKFA